MISTTADPGTARVMFSSASDDWPTPQAFYDELDAEFDFALDVCASVANHKAPTYYALDHADPARRDGLARDWAADARAAGGAVWVNPPYGRGIGAWMEKAAIAAAAGVTTVALVPARTDTAWFHEYVVAAGAEVRYVRGRLRFGAATSGAPFASLVVVYRAHSKVTARSEVAAEHVGETSDEGRGEALPPVRAREVSPRRNLLLAGRWSLTQTTPSRPCNDCPVYRNAHLARS